MENFSGQRPNILVFFLSICFLVGLVFSGYYEMSEVDIFSTNPSFENQDLSTLTTVEKVKVNLSYSYFENPLLIICNSFSLVLPISLDNQINCPIRC